MKKNRLFKFIIAALPALCIVSLSGCNNSSGEQVNSNLHLSDTEITLIEGGETHQLIVYENEEPYLGQISWSSSYAIYATVYQGIVKGIRAGTTEITAKIGGTSLKCSVTVNKNLISNIETYTAFSGSGDIDLTLSSVELVPGSTYSATQIKTESGEVLSNKIYQDNGTFYLRNNFPNQLTEGKYFVEYSISNGGLTSSGFKPINIKPTNEYKDLFVLDPLNGTETIFGYTANQSSYLGDLYENPGEYVKYNESGNTGYTDANHLSQNRDEFLNSLIQSGYNGYFTNSTTKGYDTTYRYYCRKDNYTTSPRPFFYLDMPESTNPMWDYLDQLPSDASIDIWVRCYFRAYGETNYVFNQTNFMYTFKGMNDANNYIANCSSFAAFTDKVNGWSKYSIGVSQALAYLSGSKHLALCWETNATEPGEFYFEVYSVELSGVAEYQYAPNKVAKNQLIGHYTNVFDDQTMEIKNPKTQSVLVPGVDYVISGENINFNVGNGEYSVIYHTTKGGYNVFDVTKSIYVGIASRLASKDDISKSAWTLDLETGYKANSPVGLPSELIGNKQGVCYTKTLVATGRSAPVFKIASLLSEINNISNDKSLVFYCYFTHALKANGNGDIRFYLSNGGPHLANGAQTIYYNGGPGGYPIENQPTVVGAWTTIEIPISTIKSFMATKPEVKPDTISFEMQYENNTDGAVYYYSIVLE